MKNALKLPNKCTEATKNHQRRVLKLLGNVLKPPDKCTKATEVMYRSTEASNELPQKIYTKVTKQIVLLKAEATKTVQKPPKAYT